MTPLKLVTTTGCRLHVINETGRCWCNPHIDGLLTLHRDVMLSHDNQERATLYRDELAQA